MEEKKTIPVPTTFDEMVALIHTGEAETLSGRNDCESTSASASAHVPTLATT